jgi:hypothetical protein
MSRRTAVGLLLAAICAAAFAHRAPDSFVRLEFTAAAVRAEVLVPQSELVFAMPGAHGTEEFTDYLLRHVAVESPAGTPWTVVVQSVRSTAYFEHEYLLAELALTPPAGESMQEFVLIDDAITHEVRNHLVVITKSGAQPRVLGTLQYPQSRLAVSELPLKTE